jgi:hypothetical protein
MMGGNKIVNYVTSPLLLIRRALAQGVSDHGPLSFEQDTDTTSF